LNTLDSGGLDDSLRSHLFRGAVTAVRPLGPLARFAEEPGESGATHRTAPLDEVLVLSDPSVGAHVKAAHPFSSGVKKNIDIVFLLCYSPQILAYCTAIH
jgi:hypothetical protein